MSEKPKKKRGRKPKKKEPATEKPPPKKRGRKPKGGKIIKKVIKEEKIVNIKENVIIHLKCKTADILSKDQKLNSYNPSLENPEAFSLTNHKLASLNYKELETNKNNTNSQNYTINDTKKSVNNTEKNENNEKVNMKKIWKKLSELKMNLKINNASDKKSACFWCTYEFDNPAIFIPKQYTGNMIQVYGCFCSPECACAYLKNEDIDSSRKWERYTLLNNIYSKVFNYEKNIKPAPNPFYTLDKYYGNLSINEYRKLLKNERILMVVDKPMTKVLPELYEENNEIPDINDNLLDKNKSNSNNNNFRLKREKVQSNKISIVDSFNL